MNKKGELTMKKTIEVVLAIIVIAGLVYLGARIYSVAKSSNEMKIAEVHLNQIIDGVNLLEEGDSFNYYLYSPKGWILIAWPTDYAYTHEKSWWEYPLGLLPTTNKIYPPYTKTDFPNNCEVNGWEKCLCFCNAHPSNLLNECNAQSICRELNFEEVEFNIGSGLENYQRPIIIDNLIKNNQQIKFELIGNKLKVTAIKE